MPFSEQLSLANIYNIAGGDKELFQDIIVLYQSELKEERAAYTTALLRQDYAMAAQMVHKLKHKIALVGLMDGYCIANNFEKELKENSLSLQADFEVLLDTIHQHFHSLFHKNSF